MFDWLNMNAGNPNPDSVVLTLKVLNFWKCTSYCSLKPLWSGMGGSSAGSYLANPTSPIPSHCASIVAASTVRVNHHKSSIPKSDQVFVGMWIIDHAGNRSILWYAHENVAVQERIILLGNHFSVKYLLTYGAIITLLLVIMIAPAYITFWHEMIAKKSFQHQILLIF